MAFLGLKKNTVKGKEKVEKSDVKAVKVLSVGSNSGTFSRVILNPRVTEKGAFLSEKYNVYSFDVSMSATKKSVGKAVAAAYKVTPEKINILKIPAKKIFSRGKLGRTKHGKKAYVYLKKGDKIEFV